MFSKGSVVVLVVFVCCICMASSNHDQVTEPSSTFLSSLVSRVLESEPREIREYRTSCIREPGCRWKCQAERRCQCVCGKDKKRRQ